MFLAVLLSPAPLWPQAAVASASASTEPAGRLPTGREATSAIFDGQHVYIFGGREGGQRLDDILRYDPATETVTKLSTKLPTPREETSAAFDGRYAYIVGGKDNGHRLADILRFDTATGLLETMAAKLPTGRQATSSVVAGSTLVVLGGFNGGPSTQIVLVNLGTGELRASSHSLPGGRHLASAIYDGTHVYLFGGKGEIRYADILRYDPSSDSLTAMGARLPTGRDATSAFWDGSAAYIVGGRDDSGRLNQVLRYEPTTDTISTFAITFESEREATSAVHDGSYGLVFGGRNNGHRLTDIVRLDVRTGAPSDLVARSGPDAGQISLRWTAADESEFSSPILGYRVYRGLSSGQTQPHATVGPADTSFIDGPLPNGVTRHYRVTAFSAEGEGDFSNEAHASTFVGPLPPLPSGREATTSVYIGGAAFVFGGQAQPSPPSSSELSSPQRGSSADSTGTPVNEIVRYDPETGEITVLDQPLPPKCCAVAIATQALVFLFGADGEEKCCEQQGSLGSSGSGSSSTDPFGPAGRAIYVFDPATETLTQLEQQLPRSVCCVSGFFTGEYIYLFGGDDGVSGSVAGASGGAALDGARAPSGEIIRFNPVTFELHVLENEMPIPKCCFPAIWTGVAGFLFGGSDDAEVKCCDAGSSRGAGSSGDGALSDILVFDPESETVTVLGTELPIPKCCFSGVFGDDLIYLFGGDGGGEKCCAGGDASRAVEEQKLDEILVFNPVDHTIRTLSDRLPSARSHTSAVWDGQRAMIFGGDDGSQSLAEVLGFYPGAPQNARATAGPSAGEITVRWDAPADGSEETSTGYHVYAMSEGAPWERVATIVLPSNRTFLESGLGDGATRTYRVSAFDDTNEGPMSHPASARTFSTPSAPRNLEATMGPEISDVTLTWDAPADTGGLIHEYRIYRETDLSAKGLYAVVAGTLTTYVDPDCDLASISCHYTVTAVNPSGEGAESNRASAIGLDEPVPAHETVPLLAEAGLGSQWVGMEPVVSRGPLRILPG